MKKIILALALVATSSAFASVKGGKIGVNFQYSSKLPSIGAWWHIIDLIAVNPYIGFDSSNDKTLYTTGPAAIGCAGITTNCTKNVSSNTWTFGLDIPIYVAKFTALDLFVAPGIQYGSTSGSTKTENATNGQSLEVTTGATATWTFGLAAGLQIAILEQLHVFGKAGFEYSIKSYPTVTGTADYLDKTNSFTTARAAVGAIFYFN